MPEPTLHPVSSYFRDACERCHKLKQGRWYETSDDGSEWFYCDACREYYENQDLDTDPDGWKG